MTLIAYKGVPFAWSEKSFMLQRIDKFAKRLIDIQFCRTEEIAKTTIRQIVDRRR